MTKERFEIINNWFAWQPKGTAKNLALELIAALREKDADIEAAFLAGFEAGAQWSRNNGPAPIEALAKFKSEVRK